MALALALGRMARDGWWRGGDEERRMTCVGKTKRKRGKRKKRREVRREGGRARGGEMGWIRDEASEG
jgi:hypothetical protein